MKKKDVLDQKEVTERALTMPEKAKAIIVLDNDGYLRASDFLVQIKTFRKNIDDVFGPIVSQAYKAWKEANKQKKKIEEPLEEAEGIAKKAMAAYKEIQEKIRMEQEAKLQEAENSRAEAAGEDAIPMIVPVSVPKAEGVSYSKIWKFRVVDIDKVPRIYLVLDHTKVGVIVKALKDQTRIEGIEVFAETVVTVRTE